MTRGSNGVNNGEMVEAIQAIKDMTAALLQNQQNNLRNEEALVSTNSLTPNHIR